MKSYYTGKHAAGYNRIWQNFLQKTLDAAVGAIDIEGLNLHVDTGQRPMRFLDVACGTGLLLENLAHLFPSAHLYGIDASEDMLMQAQQLLHGHASVHLAHAALSGAEGTGLPYPSAFFNLITCTNALHYFQEPVDVLKELSIHLGEQGLFVLEDYVLWMPPFLWKPVEWAIQRYDPEHHTLSSLAEAQHLCQQAGLQVVKAYIFPIDFFCQGWVICATRDELS